jgi:DNA processing protein
VKVADFMADVVKLEDPRHAQRWKEIYDPRLALYVGGSVELLAMPAIAVVGTPHPTRYGVGLAEQVGLLPVEPRVHPSSAVWRGVWTRRYIAA